VIKIKETGIDLQFELELEFRKFLKEVLIPYAYKEESEVEVLFAIEKECKDITVSNGIIVEKLLALDSIAKKYSLRLIKDGKYHSEKVPAVMEFEFYFTGKEIKRRNKFSYWAYEGNYISKQGKEETIKSLGDYFLIYLGTTLISEEVGIYVVKSLNSRKINYEYIMENYYENNLRVCKELGFEV